MSQWTPPKSVTILGKRIRVKLDAEMEEHGEANSDTLTIRIKKSDPPEMQRMTLLHECMHMVLRISGIAFLFNDVQEEAIVRSMESGLWPLVEKSWMKDRK